MTAPYRSRASINAVRLKPFTGEIPNISSRSATRLQNPYFGSIWEIVVTRHESDYVLSRVFPPRRSSEYFSQIGSQLIDKALISFDRFSNPPTYLLSTFELLAHSALLCVAIRAHRAFSEAPRPLHSQSQRSAARPCENARHGAESVTGSARSRVGRKFASECRRLRRQHKFPTQLFSQDRRYATNFALDGMLMRRASIVSAKGSSVRGQV